MKFIPIIVMTVDSRLRGNDKKIAGVTFERVQLIATEIKGVTVVNPKSWRLFELFAG